MKVSRTKVAGTCLLIAGLAFGSSQGAADSYESLRGLEGLEVAWDFRLDHPAKAALFLELIHRTYRDQSLASMSESPRFTIVVSGAAVRLIAEGQTGFSEESERHLREIAARIAEMAEDGIRVEGCLAAAALFDVDPGLFLGEIEEVPNAWISIAGYEAQGLSIIPVF
jgi:intracellular sulfur oxidation DsrE/DsrF family protein